MKLPKRSECAYLQIRRSDLLWWTVEPAPGVIHFEYCVWALSSRGQFRVRTNPLGYSAEWRTATPEEWAEGK